MPAVKTSELIGPALDWAVATALGYKVVGTAEEYGYTRWRTPDNCTLCYVFCPSTDWSQAGTIIAREGILFIGKPGAYLAWIPMDMSARGPTHLIAAMRAFVASHLGEEIDIPEELA